LGRRRKEAPEGPERQPSSSTTTTTTKKKSNKGKQKKAAPKSHGVDPLEIAYGPIVGTNPKLTEDDFKVDLEEGTHRPQEDAVHEPRTVSPEPKLGLPPRDGEEEENERGDGAEEDRPSPTFSVGSDDEEFRNVWDK
jgi:hypothetical protein